MPIPGWSRKLGSPVFAGFVLLASGWNVLSAQEDQQFTVEHPDCTLFGPKRESFLAANKRSFRLSALTRQVADRLEPAAQVQAATFGVPGGTRTGGLLNQSSSTI